MKGFGYNILSDMLKRPGAKALRQPHTNAKRWVRLLGSAWSWAVNGAKPLPAAWFHTHGAMPRPGSTYRGARRNAPRKARRMALLRKRFEAALRRSST